MAKFNLVPHSTSFEMKNREFSNNRRIVYVGRIEPGKGIEYLCEVLYKMEEIFSLDIIGGGRLYSTLNEKFGTKFRFHGYRSKEYVMDQFEKADFFILPSFSEHCPVSVLEGMACGCIPILSNFGNIPQMIRNESSGFIFDLSSQHEIYVQNMFEVIGQALKIDVVRANEMIQNNYRLLNNHFSPEIMLKKTLEVFENA